MSDKVATPDPTGLRLFLVAAIVSIVIGVICVILARTGYPPCFETNDDVVFMLSLSGMGMSFTAAEMPFLNIALSKTLYALYALKRDIPWYGILQWGMLLTSLFVMVYSVAARRRRVTFGCLCLYLSLGAFLYVPSLMSLQWTKTAFVASHASFLGILSVVLRGGPSRVVGEERLGFLILCGALGMFGFCLRDNSWQLALLATIPVGGVIVCSQNWRLHRLHPRHTAVITLAFGAVLALGMLHKLYYERHEGWAHWHRVNRAKSLFLDYNRVSPATVNQAVLDAGRWSQNDFAMLRSWAYFDEQTFSPERMEAAGVALSAVHKRDGAVRILPVLRWLDRSRILMCMGILSCAALCLSSRVRSAAVGILVLTLATLTLCICLALWLKLPDRVAFSLLSTLPWGVLLVGAGSASDRPAVQSKWSAPVAIALCIAALICAALSRGSYWRKAARAIRVTAQDSWQLQQSLDHLCRILPKPATLFIWGVCFPLEGVLPFQRQPLPSSIALVWLGTNNQSPNIRREMQALEAKELIGASLQDDVYWILPVPESSPSRVLTTFVLEHHGIILDIRAAYPDVSFDRRGMRSGLYTLATMND